MKKEKLYRLRNRTEPVRCIHKGQDCNLHGYLNRNITDLLHAHKIVPWMIIREGSDDRTIRMISSSFSSSWELYWSSRSLYIHIDVCHFSLSDLLIICHLFSFDTIRCLFSFNIETFMMFRSICHHLLAQMKTILRKLTRWSHCSIIKIRWSHFLLLCVSCLDWMIYRQ